MSKTLDEKIAELPPERRAKITKRAKKLVRDHTNDPLSHVLAEALAHEHGCLLNDPLRHHEDTCTCNGGSVAPLAAQDEGHE